MGSTWRTCISGISRPDFRTLDRDFHDEVEDLVCPVVDWEIRKAVAAPFLTNGLPCSPGMEGMHDLALRREYG